MGGQRNTSNQCDAWETRDYGGLDVERLRTRADYYARKAGASDKSAGEVFASRNMQTSSHTTIPARPSLCDMSQICMHSSLCILP